MVAVDNRMADCINCSSNKPPSSTPQSNGVPTNIFMDSVIDHLHELEADQVCFTLDLDRANLEL